MRIVVMMGFLLSRLAASAQSFAPAEYPRGYFRDPLNIPISLAANFGELRPNHYHMGLDIRTEKRENLPVFAAADGSIVKVVIEPFGFGQAIYLRHPNGFTTVYAHLNEFFPALSSYIHQQQYRLESWQGTFDIPPDLFVVKKGSLIAYSGNRGGSQGPHLHFEIRRTADDVNLNPLLFGLPVADKTAPVIQALAIYDRGRSLYEQSPKLVTLHRSGGANPGKYVLTGGSLVVMSSRVSFAISAFDTQTGSTNPNGIFQAILFEDERMLTGFQMDNISYDDTRKINAHIDYKTRATGGPFFQHLSRLPGYASPTIYRTGGTNAGDAPGYGFADDGIVELGDGREHIIRIQVKDAYGNESELRYQVRYEASLKPSAAITGGGKRFYPGMLDGLEMTDCAFYIGEKSLYDSAYINYKASAFPVLGVSLPGGISAVHSIGETYIPLQEPLLVRIRPVSAPGHLAAQGGSPGKDWGDTSSRARVVMVNINGSKREVIKPEWQGGWASGRFREFGNFQLVEDREPPVVTALGIQEGALLSKAHRIAFSVTDNLGAIRNFRAELDGKWLCFTNDKAQAFIYIFDEHCGAGPHLLQVSVEDIAGNKTIKEYHFTR